MQRIEVEEMQESVSVLGEEIHPELGLDPHAFLKDPLCCRCPGRVEWNVPGEIAFPHQSI